jgi:hypothetical protein
MNPALVQLILAELPAAIALFKDLFAKQNPGAPTPTDTEVAAALHEAVLTTLAKDDQWLKDHPTD